MSRRRSVFKLSALTAPEMSLATAMERLPSDNKVFNAHRYRWIKVVRGHPMLTAAQRQVGLVIAQDYINNNPENPWFRSAWPAHQRIAIETGLTRRTVLSAIGALKQCGLIAVEHGGGVKVPGGRTDRYTLRMDWLDVLERAAQSLRHKDVKILHGSNCEGGRKLDQSREKNTESGEIDDQLTRNSPFEDVKGLRTTLPNKTFLESCRKTYSGPSTQSEPQSLGATLLAINGSKKAIEMVTSGDHTALALCVGDGDLKAGYERLQAIPPDDVDVFALRLRKDPSSAIAIRLELNTRFGACDLQ